MMNGGGQRGRNEDGFTLVEVILVIALLGLVFALVLPRFTTAPTVASTSRQLIGMIRSLSLAASATKRPHRLYLDLDQQAYWAVAMHPDGERPPADSSLAERVTLPARIRLLDAITPAQGKIGTSRAMIRFTPGGRTERCWLHLTDGDGNTLTLIINPLTAGIQVLDRYIEPVAPDPLTDRVKTAIFPIPESFPSPIPVSGGFR